MVDYLDLIERGLRILEKSMAKPTTRKSFAKSIKNQVLRSQDKKCKDCGNKSDVFDYDHIDNNSSNNSLKNCQALCPACHARKTRNIKKKNRKLFQIKSPKIFVKKLKKKLNF